MFVPLSQTMQRVCRVVSAVPARRAWERAALGMLLAVLLGPGLSRGADDGQTIKAALSANEAGPNRLTADGWRPFESGFQRDGNALLCENPDAAARRGASQTVVLNQQVATPIVASAWSKAEGVSGGADPDYSLYLDLVYADGTPLWGQSAPFAVGTHDWRRREVLVMPDKPVRSVTVNLLLRGHAGKAWFRDAELRTVEAPEGACLFDGLPVRLTAPPAIGFQLRDVAAGTGFVRIAREALGVTLEAERQSTPQADFWDVQLRDTSGQDRALTLVFAVPVPSRDLTWLIDPRRQTAVEAPREYSHTARFRVGNGRLSRYPLAAVAGPSGGTALGIDMAQPAFFRGGYNAGTGELFLAWDLGLCPEKPEARLRFCRYAFDPQGGFRAALAQYYGLFPEAFQRRIPEQGLWMPFAKISRLENWQDFGFRFKEGNDETAWDDEHGILTFRYTEPMTWWMTMPESMPRTLDAALAEARRLADSGHPNAQAFLSSGFHDETGGFPARLLDTPWCNGAVWSTNAMPGIAGEQTEFRLKWNDQLRERLYGENRRGDLDGEYIDSAEGYVTDEMNFRREHFAAATTPLSFSATSHRVGIFRGLIVYEYTRAMAADVHGMGKLMMANSTPINLCWLAPYLDVMGTETDWNPGNRWRPMSDAELLYRRALCKDKPYCFLMNTRFEQFPPELVEKYMKRSLAYGMFPGFFSHNASQGHYFTRPELYDRDRPLFKKYVPLCKRVAEAGWEPQTRATSSDDRVYVERFGTRFFTVFNDSDTARTVTIQLETPPKGPARELLTGHAIAWENGAATLTLAAEDVAVIELD